MYEHHGQYDAPEYFVWAQMIQRCTNPKCKRFAVYGGRGITVCDRWRQSFGTFMADMGPRPSPQHSLDRIDNDGSYIPENCRWATRVEQARNCQDAVRLTWQGRTLHVHEWADILHIAYCTLLTRVNRGWSVDRIFTQPVQVRRSNRATPRPDTPNPV